MWKTFLCFLCIYPLAELDVVQQIHRLKGRLGPSTLSDIF